jgi:hypothetical protein
MAKDVSKTESEAQHPPVRRKVIYARNEPIPVTLRKLKDYGCGVASYSTERESSDLRPLPFSFLGFKSCFDGSMSVSNSEEELYYLAHMYVPGYFEEVVTANAHVPVDDKTKKLINNPGLKERGFLGLFILKQYPTYRRNKSGIVNNSQLECKKRGEFGCPLLLQLPPNPRVTNTSRVPKPKEVLGYFTFNGMRFYPFIMIDFTVCYYVCDALGPFDWNYHKNGKLKKAHEILPAIALKSPVSYEPTLGIWMTRSAELVEMPPTKATS